MSTRLCTPPFAVDLFHGFPLNFSSRFPETRSLLHCSSLSPKYPISAVASSVGALIKCSRSAESNEMQSHEYARGSW